nr:MAG: RNA-dependent RNA polymerase [Arthropod nodavirus 2]
MEREEHRSCGGVRIFPSDLENPGEGHVVNMHYVSPVFTRLLCWSREQFDVKSLALVAGTLGVVYIVRHRQQVKGYLIAGPYPSVNAFLPLRALQRAVIDKTRADVRVDWFPLDSKLRAQHVRSSDNGHPISGAVRDVARELIVAAIDSIGATKFEISPAGHTLDEGRRIHQHYAIGDLHASVAADEPQSTDVIACIDVDYYLRDPNKIFGYINPVILHTFQPIAVSGMDGDSPFRIIDDYVHYDVSGGASWRHKVWDWARFGEFLEFPCQSTGLLGWLLGFLGIKKYVYQKVHHARPWKECPHRALVWLLPQYTAWQISWLPSDLRARKLQRTHYADDSKPGWNTLVYVTPLGLRINFGRSGEDASMDMEKDNFDILMGLQSAQSVTSRLLGMGYNKPQQLAIVGQYFRGASVNLADHVRLARPATVQVHWPASFEVEEGESSARSYSNPVVTDENLMPMIKRWECLSDSLERRVTFVSNSVEPPMRYNRLAEEFIRLMVPDPGIGHPMTLEDAAAELSKPSQVLAVANVWETVDMDHRRMIESFVKNEPTMKNGRIISSFADARFLLKFSTYTLPFRNRVLHSELNRHWFCPGLTPGEITAKVMEYVGSVFQPAEGDYSNLDGSISLWLQRRVMNAVYLRYYHPAYRKDLTKYTDMMVDCPARAKRFGFRYEAGVGVKSGSPTTCDLNTVANAFVMYCAVRRVFPELSPEQAYQHIGLSFGDDSLFDSAFSASWNKVATDLGLTLKVEKFKPDHGVTFLARVFPDPWTTPTSFQDPLRTWRKLHLTSRDPTVPLADAVCDRLEGYLTTDRLTPITSTYASAMLRHYLPQTTRQRAERKDRLREVPYWLTQGGAWPQRPQDVSLMSACIASRLQMPLEVVRALNYRFSQIVDPWAVNGIDHSEGDDPYVNTIHADGSTSEDRVDLRILERDRHVHHSRANRGVPQADSRSVARHEGGSQVGRHHGSQACSGPGSFQQVPRRHRGPRRAGNGQFAGQAAPRAPPPNIEDRGVIPRTSRQPTNRAQSRRNP